MRVELIAQKILRLLRYIPMRIQIKYFLALFIPLIALKGITKESSFHKLKTVKTKIAVNNIPLAKVNSRIISLADVVKELDMRMYLHSPEEYKNVNNRIGFYKESWKRQLDELILLEFLKKEAEEKKIKISDADIRQELVSRYGSDLINKLHEANLTYDDVKNSVKNDILSQQMNWYGFVNKIFYKVGPQTLKTAYDEYIQMNPGNESWKYQFLTVRVKNKEKAEQIAFKIKALDPTAFPHLQALKDSLTSLFSKEEEFKISLTEDLSVEDKDIAPAHKTILSHMALESVSAPSFMHQNNEYLIRVFFLKDHIKSEPIPFQQMTEKLKHDLVGRMAEKERGLFFQKLKDKYGYSDDQLYLPLPADFTPFSLKEE
ncbi:MAG: hypothetical protein FJZ62_02900 [Chlamydiae bacterium]|nr:hypothetical protein [Chlamydiota bacterium]